MKRAKRTKKVERAEGAEQSRRHADHVCKLVRSAKSMSEAWYKGGTPDNIMLARSPDLPPGTEMHFVVDEGDDHQDLCVSVREIGRQPEIVVGAHGAELRGEWSDIVQIDVTGLSDDELAEKAEETIKELRRKARSRFSRLRAARRRAAEQQPSSTEEAAREPDDTPQHTP